MSEIWAYSVDYIQQLDFYENVKWFVKEIQSKFITSSLRHNTRTNDWYFYTFHYSGARSRFNVSQYQRVLTHLYAKDNVNES